MASENGLLAAALAYAALGWRVFPLATIEDGVCSCPKRGDCPSPGKHPRIREWQIDATTDERTIRRWWRSWPRANVGVVTGETSGIWALDVDADKDGEVSLGALLDGRAIPDTVEAITGGGGRHVVFAWTERVVNDSKTFGDAYPGLDTRGDGGFIVAPPSLHVSGGIYAWEIASDPLDGKSPQPAPGWLLSVLRSRPKDPSRSAASASAPIIIDGVPDFTPPKKGAAGGRIVEGERDTTLHRIASALRGEGRDEAGILDELRAINEARVEPPLADADLVRISRSAARYPTEAEKRARRAASDPVALLDRPEIMVSNRQLRDVTHDGILALDRANRPPYLFAQGPALVRVEEAEDKHFIQALDVARMREALAHVADWQRLNEKSQTKEAFVPKELAENILASRNLATRFPALAGLASAPFMDKEGEIVRAAGYDARSRWYLTDGGPWPDFEGDGPAAAAWILDDLFGDFRFKDDASRAHALALFLLPFVRASIDGPTPLHFVDAPTPGSGKGLLVQTALFAGLGFWAAAVPLPPDENELSKLLFSLLSQGEQTVFFDNVRGAVKSASLEACLTARVYKARTLGVTSAPETRVESVFALAVNNGRLSKDMARRSLWIRLDAKEENPEDRADFRHANLYDWAEANRARLVSAALAMCEHWSSQGRPPGGRKKGSYERWATTVGGILDACGVKGFLANDKDLKWTSNEEDDGWRAFYAAWWSDFRDQRVTVKHLKTLAEGKELLEEVFLKAKTDRGRATAFGQALASRDGRVLDGRAPEKMPPMDGYPTYRMRLVDAAAADLVHDGDVRPVPAQTSLYDEGEDTLDEVTI